MGQSRKRRIVLLMTKQSSVCAAAVIIVLDQAAKYFYSFQNYRIVKNPGLPFGINLPGFFDLYVVAGLLAIFIFLFLFYFRALSWEFVLVAGGSLSNLFDRIYFGYVRDFIDIGIATMNVADFAIWIGIGMLLLKIRSSS